MQEVPVCTSFLSWDACAQVLASAKLVAVCRLQHCQLTLVPYLDAGSGTLRMIGFLTGDDLGSPV